jgi:hypothetical protein
MTHSGMACSQHETGGRNGPQAFCKTGGTAGDRASAAGIRIRSHRLRVIIEFVVSVTDGIGHYQQRTDY